MTPPKVPTPAFLALPAFPSRFRSQTSPTCLRRPSHPLRVPPRSVVQVGSEPFHATVDPLGDARFTPSDGETFHARAKSLSAAGVLPDHVSTTLSHWYGSYRKAVEHNKRFKGDATEFTENMFSTLLELARRAVCSPIEFGPYHERIRQPFDYYKFGFDFASMLLNPDDSTVLGRDSIAEAVEYARQGHNIIFLSNHQSEGDPYAIDALFAWVAGCHRTFCEEIIFMAGDRVTNDPVVSPFSAGRNLLTVYSKKHINDVPELRAEKLLHNRRTIATTAKLFKQGGKVLWFAPSGGRDRRSTDTARVEVSKFDEGAVDMMRFTANKSGVPCHFYPMSLWTYDMLPPPTNVGGPNFGEERVVNHIPMHMYVGEEIDWSNALEAKDKIGRRVARCNYVQDIVVDGYRAIGGYDR